MTKSFPWYPACLEIIERCVAPDMYNHAMRMLENVKYEELRIKKLSELSPLAQLNRRNPKFFTES